MDAGADLEKPAACDDGSQTRAHQTRGTTGGNNSRLQGSGATSLSPASRLHCDNAQLVCAKQLVTLHGGGIAKI